MGELHPLRHLDVPQRQVPAMPNTNQPHAAQYASLTVAALLTIAAASNLIDVYGSALSWTSAAIPATIIGSLVALAGLVPALRLWCRCCSWRVRSWWSARSSS